jgi:hypothetical protein
MEVIVESEVQTMFEPLAILEQQNDMQKAHRGEAGTALEPSQIETLVEFCCGFPSHWRHEPRGTEAEVLLDPNRAHFGLSMILYNMEASAGCSQATVSLCSVLFT